MSTTSTIEPGELPSDDRERMLELLEEGIREAHAKIENGRIRDPEHEQVRIKWIRALAYSVGNTGN